MRTFAMTAVAVCFVIGMCGQGLAAVPWASSVVSYSYDGTGNLPADGKYCDPQLALGEPSRMAGLGEPWGVQVASVFNPPYGSGEVVSIRSGGSLVVGFDQPIVHDALHPYGVDLIVFGTAGFWDDAWPNGQMTSPAMFFSEHPGVISVSADGIDWRVVPDAWASSLFPTQGYMDSGPQDLVPGHVPTDFRKPVNPALTLADFDGLTYAQVLALYNGSGGGTPVDISKAGLSQVQYVKITVPAGVNDIVSIDAFSVVPEPMSLLLLAVGGMALARRRRA